MSDSSRNSVRKLYGPKLGQMLDSILRNLRVATRSLSKRPVFLLVATLSLAIGIGANTAIFSMINAIFITKYPFQEPEQLVRIYTSVQGRTEYGTSSFPNYLDIKGFEDTFQSVGAYKPVFSRIELEDEAVPVMGEGVSHSLFPTLGVEAAKGRTFLPEEDLTPGEHPVVMLGHGLWQRAFAGDPEIVGKTVRLTGKSFTVVGITPEGYRGLISAGITTDFFFPLVNYGDFSGFTDSSHLKDRLERRYLVVGRLAEGMTLTGARARMKVLSRQIQQANPEIDQEWVFAMLGLNDVALGPDFDSTIRPFAGLFLAAGGLVLLLSCTNLSSFLLARGRERRKEIALRLALGAGRGELIRQLLTETVLLAMLGGAIGLLAAQWVLGLLTKLQAPIPIPLTLDLSLSWPVLLFTFGISALACLLFGLAPALRSTNPEIAPSLTDERTTPRLRRFGLRNGMVAVQMALSVVLLVGGGLFIRSLGAARNADLGFSIRDAGIVWADLGASGIPAAEQLAVREELTRRAQALPGIEAATTASHIPFFFSASGGPYTIPDAEPVQGGYNVEREEVDPAFFETMGIPLVKGRSFTADDRPGSQSVMIINETAADRFWPGESPLGKEIFPLGSRQGLRVVGVVGNTKIDSLRGPVKPLFYFPIAQSPDFDLILVARGQLPAEEITAMLRQMVKEAYPGLMIMETRTMAENIGAILFPSQMAAFLLGAFGLLSLILATIGLYGVVSFSVAQRTREVGIRMSLGASSVKVISMVLKSAMGLVGVGATIGLAATFVLTHFIRHILYGVKPWDPITFIGVPLLLLCVATMAALIPAHRASRVNPIQALKVD
jgi:predicted permease